MMLAEPGAGTRERAVLIPFAIVLAVVLAACGGSTTKASSPGSTSTTVHIVQVARLTPSKSAQMVCAPEAQKDIAKLVGTSTTAPVAPTWVDHLYSCRYAYAGGAMVLSIKELSSKHDTSAYFASLHRLLGQREQIKGMGQGAFVTKNGSLVLRKDYKVLVVDTSGLPDPFGGPPQPRKQVAVGVGITVLGCWTGA